MMQNGLHIGLAAWINAQRNSGSFAVYPASPVPAALADLDSAKDASDIAKAAEFARLVNFVPRQGEVADVFSASTVLWDVHRETLGRMDFAAEPWTGAERAEYQAARDTLYKIDPDGRPSPYSTLLLYEEMKSAMQDLKDGGGSPVEVAQALANWIVIGFKLQVEDALEVIVRLSGRSSRNLAENERASLAPERLLVRGDLSFAPTYFAPISALARETWMEAKLSFDDIDSVVGSGPERAKWTAFRANRVGEVSFNYMVLRCLRPWYTAPLYRADDWKISGGDTRVSQGNGNEGLIPAYVDAVYLVSVKDVTTRPNRPRTPPLRLPPLGDIRVAPMPVVRPAPGDIPQPAIPFLRKAVGKLRPLAEPLVLDQVQPTLQAGGALHLPIDDAHFTRARVGELRRVSVVDVGQRVALAQLFLEGKPWFPPPAQVEPQIYVVGFGCEKIPFSPNPNLNYRWS